MSKPVTADNFESLITFQDKLAVTDHKPLGFSFVGDVQKAPRDISDNERVRIGEAMIVGVRDVLARRAAGYGIGERYFGPLQHTEGPRGLYVGIDYRGGLVVANETTDGRDFRLYGNVYSGDYEFTHHEKIYILEVVLETVKQLFYQSM